MLIRILARFFAAWPTPGLMRAGRVLGSIWFHGIRIRRGVAESAVARAFPEKSPAEVRRIVKGNFQHLMISLLESLAYIAYPESKLRALIRMEGLEESVLGPRERGMGVVAISAHIGNFEMCTDACGLLHRLPMLLVARLPKGGFARSMLDAFRGRNTGMEVFEPKGSGPKVVERLRNKRSVLAFVIDQNLRRGRGIFLPFLGEIANTTTGFASLQRKAEAALCVVFMHREPDGTHRLRTVPVTPSDHPNLRVAMINDTWTMSKHIEGFVREHPEQWFWVHRRWKAQPQPGDLVRTERGLERFGRGRIAAFLGGDDGAADDPPATTEAIRRLKEAGIAACPADAVRRAREEPDLDLEASLFVGRQSSWLEAARSAGIPVAEEGHDIMAVVDRFLDRTVGIAKD